MKKRYCKISVTTCLWIAILCLTHCKKDVTYLDNKPQLEITVTQTDGKTVAGVYVILYATQKDWENHKNIVASKSTDASGKVLFTDLNETVYFFYAEKGQETNFYNVATFPNVLEKNEIRELKIKIN